MHEASLHLENDFLTLTFDDHHLPAHGGLDYSIFQKFMKRLRKHFSPATVRFYMCGEYGEKFDRPHFHACIFGVRFRDRSYFKTTESGEKIYRSPSLESLWPFGHSSCGDVTFESAAYVARYIMKKINGPAGPKHYEKIDPQTGEVISRKPEFTKMSLKPGVGATWFARYRSDVYPHDYVVARGKKSRPPRYYDKLLEKIDPVLLEDLKFQRELNGRAHADDNTPERLAVRHAVANAGINLFSRKLN
jgi:hypothetical protein